MLQWAVAMGCANRAGQSAVTLAMTDLAVLMELRTDFDLPACGLNGTCWAGRDAGLFCAGLAGFTLYGRHFWQFFCGQEHSTEACPKPILRMDQQAHGAQKTKSCRLCQWSEVHKSLWLCCASNPSARLWWIGICGLNAPFHKIIKGVLMLAKVIGIDLQVFYEMVPECGTPIANTQPQIDSLAAGFDGGGHLSLRPH